MSTPKLEAETARLSSLLLGKVISRVVRHRESEVLVEFKDGTRLFIDAPNVEIELSITDGQSRAHPA